MTPNDPQILSDYARHQADKKRIDGLREHIAAFVDSPPSSVRGSALPTLSHAVRVLGEESARLVELWN